MNLIEKIRKSSLPRWIIFLVDIFISLTSISIAYLLRFNFNIPPEHFENLYFVIPFVVSVRALSFITARLYASLLRYTSTIDAIRIFIILLSGSLVFVLSNVLKYYFFDARFMIPFSIIGIDLFASFFLIFAMRLTARTIYKEMRNIDKEKSNVIIYGSDNYGNIVKQTLDRDAGAIYKVVAFISHTGKNTGHKIDGISIYSIENLSNLLAYYPVSLLIIAHRNISHSTRTHLVDTCLHYNARVLTVPDISSWINGELSFRQIREIKIEDLLERDPIQLDKRAIKRQILGKTLLVTGAAGSIGSELVRQITAFAPQKILLLDQAESPLYEIELDLIEKLKFRDYEIIIADTTRPEQIERIFEQFSPHIVFHAAAYKHVPMMENNPHQAVRNNVLGTKLVADLAVKYGSEKFIMVSTDKAVRPTNVMGASKRIAEIYTQALSKTTKTNFVTTRFGNVLGSNGSVIPRFRKQIEQGGPVTVTHPEITRFFMTIPEACQLVLEASAIGKGGEIFIFDMGKSVKIVDLAKKMIKLSGLTLGKDIQIKFTGLRPGEKLYEELLSEQENNLPTHHKQIMIAEVKQYQISEIETHLRTLKTQIKTADNLAIVKTMKKIVPEFVSKNSIYEALDEI